MASDKYGGDTSAVTAGLSAVSFDAAPGDDELLAASAPASAEDDKFDRIVGALEGIIMSPEFRSQHEDFCRRNCHHFDDGDENKLICTDLFTEYTEITETAIERRLVEEVEGFDMAEFFELLEARADELVGDVFDVLMGFGQFEEFKSLMLSYKEQVAFERGDTGGGGSVAVLAPTVIALTSSGMAVAAAAGTSAGSASREPQSSGSSTAAAPLLSAGGGAGVATPLDPSVAADLDGLTGVGLGGAGAGAGAGAAEVEALPGTPQVAGADSSQSAQTQGQVASESGTHGAGRGVVAHSAGSDTGEAFAGERSDR